VSSSGKNGNPLFLVNADLIYGNPGFEYSKVDENLAIDIFNYEQFCKYRENVMFYEKQDKQYAQAMLNKRANIRKRLNLARLSKKLTQQIIEEEDALYQTANSNEQ